jgi:hypothetical protein
MSTGESALHHARHHVAQFVEDQRLGEVVVCALLQGLDRRRDRRIAGHHDHLDRLVVLADLPEQIEAVHVRHPDVRDQGVENLRADQLERLRGGAGAGHRVAPLREGFLEQQQDGALVVDD